MCSHWLYNLSAVWEIDIVGKFKIAKAIWLLSDIWSISASHYLSVGAAVTDQYFVRELFIVDLVRLHETKTTEYVQEVIENVIERFEIPRGCLHGITTDQASNMPGTQKQPAWIKELERRQIEVAFDMTKLIEEQVTISRQDVTIANGGSFKTAFPSISLTFA